MKIGTSRLEAFSDGVIAIIITITALALKLPDFKHDNTPWEIRHYLRELLPYFTSYTFSFMMIGIFWTNHHHMFHMLDKTDEPLLFQNLFFLFWMSLIPLVTAIIGANPLLPDSAALYGFVMLMTTFSFAIMRAYTLKKGLVHTDKDASLTRKVKRVSLKARSKSYMGTASYLLSVPLSYVSVYLAFICFIIPPVLFFIPDGIDDEQLAQRIDDNEV